MPTKNQILNHSAIGQECVKCKRIIDEQTVLIFTERNRKRNQELIKKAILKKPWLSDRSGRRRKWPYNDILKLKRQGLSYGQIAIKLKMNRGSIAYVVQRYLAEFEKTGTVRPQRQIKKAEAF